MVLEGMQVYPWPNRHSASRGRWEGAEEGVEMVLALSKPRDIIFHEHQPLDSGLKVRICPI